MDIYQLQSGQRRNSFILTAILTALPLISEVASANQSSDAPNNAAHVMQERASFVVSDLRSLPPDEVRSQAAKSAARGIVLVVFGGDAPLADAARAVVRESATAGYPMSSLLLANGSAGEGVAVYGLDGKQYGELIPIAANTKDQSRARVDQLVAQIKTTSSGSGSAENTPVTASDGVVKRCRMVLVTGSRVRRERVCSSAADDRTNQRDSQDSVRRVQDHGIGEPPANRPGN